MSHMQTTETKSQNLQEFFGKQWQIYQKMLDNNYMGHREIYNILHEFLINYFQKPFRMLDLGCGDASFTSQALLNTNISCYYGVDLSIPALETAKENLAKINCDKTLISGDFSQLDSVLELLPENKFDTIFMSFALHHQHLEQKYYFIEQFHNLLNSGGVFILIDVVRQPEEDRDTYVRRYLDIAKQDWSLLTQEDYSMVAEHMLLSDFPETQQTLQEISQKIGFIKFECLYCDVLNTTQLLCFYKG
ncbi:class I SAM-dependent methyltransferase [Tolypothrix sp. FACHB-123]|nr:class I SAM-dependent methyltransferase [Tolypothrix sp. FACHB-123]